MESPRGQTLLRGGSSDSSYIGGGGLPGRMCGAQNWQPELGGAEKKRKGSGYAGNVGCDVAEHTTTAEGVL